MHIFVEGGQYELPADVEDENQIRYSLRSAITNGVYIGLANMGGQWKEVIVKVLDCLRGHKAKRFSNEVRVMAALEHHRIAKYYGSGTATVGDMELPFIVMEKCYINLWHYKKGCRIRSACD